VDHLSYLHLQLRESCVPVADILLKTLSNLVLTVATSIVFAQVLEICSLHCRNFLLVCQHCQTMVASLRTDQFLVVECVTENVLHKPFLP
jgi:hypothetical protein